MKGGNGVNYTLEPANYDGQGEGFTESSVNVQAEAGMAGGRRHKRGGTPITGSGGRRRRTRRTRRTRRSRGRRSRR